MTEGRFVIASEAKQSRNPDSVRINGFVIIRLRSNPETFLYRSILSRIILLSLCNISKKGGKANEMDLLHRDNSVISRMQQQY